MRVFAVRVTEDELDRALTLARTQGYRGELGPEGGVLLTSERRVSAVSALGIAVLLNAVLALLAFVVGGRAPVPLNVYIGPGQRWLVAPAKWQLRRLGFPASRLQRAPRRDIGCWFAQQVQV